MAATGPWAVYMATCSCGETIETEIEGDADDFVSEHEESCD